MAQKKRDRGRLEKAGNTSLPANIAPVVAATSQAASGAIGTQASEEALKLSRHDKRKIQRRPTLIDYDTGGIDGKFGKGTRRAIRSWQRDNGLAKSGYLNSAQLAQLERASAKKYAIWDAKPKRYYDKKGCLREPNGRVVKGRTTLCDLSAIFQ
ncbi:MAG: peptidoglycan-binding protein [Alphaproteobacteria bacterium]|nr:peptidoglycan-binding protein [Alphaproteobacteria bacterium]